MGAHARDNAPGDQRDQANDVIANAFSLLREGIKTPELLRGYPPASVIEFRDLNIRGHLFGLTVGREPDGDEWTARPFRYSLTAGAPLFQRPVVDARGMIQDQIAIVQTFRATGVTRDETPDTLSRKLTDVVEHAIRNEPVAPER